MAAHKLRRGGVSWLVLALVVSVVGAWAPSAAVARSRGRAAIALHPRFSRQAGSYLVSGGGSVFLSGAPLSAESGTGELIDGRTGRRRGVSQAGCLPSALGGPWLAFTCGDPSNESIRLYNTVTGQTQPFTVSPAIGYDGCRLGCVTLVAVGAEWVGFQVPAGDEHIVPSYEFQNISSGQAVTTDPTGPRTTVDLSSAGLVKPLCDPLMSPVVSNGYSSGWGSVSFESGYAIAAGGAAVLERCGTDLHRRLTLTVPHNGGSYPAGCAHLACPLASNAHAIVWAAAGNRLAGLFLPSLRRFTIRIPAAVYRTSQPRPVGSGTIAPQAGSYQLALTSRTLYLGIEPHIFSIPAPVMPRPRVGRRR